MYCNFEKWAINENFTLYGQQSLTAVQYSIVKIKIFVILQDIFYSNCTAEIFVRIQYKVFILYHISFPGKKNCDP